MKSLTKLLIPMIAGSLVLGGCGDKKNSELEKVEKQSTELGRFNLENKQIYEDFNKFCNEHPNKEMHTESQYGIKFSNQKYYIDFIEKGALYVYIKGGKSFHDSGGDGLDEKSIDSQVSKDKNTGLIKIENIKDLPPEKQLEAAKEYRDLIIEIMREEKY